VFRFLGRSPYNPQRKRPCGFPQGLERRTAANSVLRNQRRHRLLKAPDLEADARPHVDVARAHRGVLTHEAISDPDLQINRAEIVADQATGGGGLIAATESHARRGIVATAGIGRRLHFKIADWADRPVADLIDSG
jgi:hypothetical protein